MTTGAAATSRCARKYTAAATRSNITPTKNTKRPSRTRSRRAPRTRKARRATGSLEDYVKTARAKLTLVDTPLPFDVGTRVECRYAESDSDVSIGDLFDSSESGSDDDDGRWAPGVVIAHHYREASFDVEYYAPYQVRLDSGNLIYVKDPPKQMRAIAQSDP